MAQGPTQQDPTFLPPDAEQLRWMVERDERARSYLRFLTLLHELLALYGENHGLPHGARQSSDLESYLARCARDVAEFEFTAHAGGGRGTAETISMDIEGNKNTALQLFAKVHPPNTVDQDVTIFLRGVVDAYTFVLQAKPKRP